MSKHSGQDSGVVEAVVRAGLGDVPVAGQGGEAEAVQVEGKRGGEFEGAQDGVAAASFGGQERVVEGSIVGDQDAAAWIGAKCSAMSA